MEGEKGEGEMIVSSQQVGREGERAQRWMGCGARLGKHSLLFASLFPFFSQGQTENQASCSCLSMWVCVCVCVWADEVDLSGLYISSRESPPTNLPPGALGHWSPSLLPREPQAAPQPPATSLVLTVMRTPRRGEEKEPGYVSMPRKATLADLKSRWRSPLSPSLPTQHIPPCASVFLLQGLGAVQAVNAVHHVAVWPKHVIFGSSGQAVEIKGGWEEGAWLL